MLRPSRPALEHGQGVIARYCPFEPDAERVAWQPDAAKSGTGNDLPDLGRTGQKVSLLSYGTGGPSGFGARTGVDRSGRRRLIRRMLDLGVNLFDTAEGYGNSEEWLGDALQGAARDSYLIATKWSPPGTVSRFRRKRHVRRVWPSRSNAASNGCEPITSTSCSSTG